MQVFNEPKRKEGLKRLRETKQWFRGTSHRFTEHGFLCGVFQSLLKSECRTAGKRSDNKIDAEQAITRTCVTHIWGGMISTSQDMALRFREPSPIRVTMACNSIQHSSSPPSNLAIACSTWRDEESKLTFYWYRLFYKYSEKYFLIMISYIFWWTTNKIIITTDCIKYLLKSGLRGK